MTAEALTLLPEPLSPRIDQRLAAVDVERDARARRGPCRPALRNSTERSRISSRWPVISAPSSRQRCSGSMAIRSQDDSRLAASVVSMMARPGKKASHQARGQIVAPLRHHQAPGDLGRLDADAEEAQARFGQHDVGELDRGDGQQRRQHHRQDVAQGDPQSARRPSPARPRRTSARAAPAPRPGWCGCRPAAG